MPDHTDTIEPLLLHWITEMQPEILRVCQRLIQTPSVNGVHNEIDMVNVLAEEAERLGLFTTISAIEPDRPNIIISTAETGETGLLLIAHSDTVPVGEDSQWTYPPFSGEMTDGNIYGRGAVDNKGGMVASLFALAALTNVPQALPYGRAQLIVVPDEETGATGTLGIRHLAQQGLLGGLGAIYTYSGRDLILGHRGVVRFKVICHGQAEHTGSPAWERGERGSSAVMGMADLLLRLETIHLPQSITPYFDQFKTLISAGTMINGGTAINIVPDYCEALIDVRTTPEYQREQVETLIRQSIDEVMVNRDDLKFELNLLNDLPAVLSDEKAALFSVLSDVTESITGIKPERAVAGPANEGYLLIERGIATVCGFGPIGDNFHGIDEYVEQDSLGETAKIYALAACRLAAYLP